MCLGPTPLAIFLGHSLLAWHKTQKIFLFWPPFLCWDVLSGTKHKKKCQKFFVLAVLHKKHAYFLCCPRPAQKILWYRQILKNGAERHQMPDLSSKTSRVWPLYMLPLRWSVKSLRSVRTAQATVFFQRSRPRARRWMQNIDSAVIKRWCQVGFVTIWLIYYVDRIGVLCTVEVRTGWGRELRLENMPASEKMTDRTDLQSLSGRPSSPCYLDIESNTHIWKSCWNAVTCLDG